MNRLLFGIFIQDFVSESFKDMPMGFIVFCCFLAIRRTGKTMIVCSLSPGIIRFVSGDHPFDNIYSTCIVVASGISIYVRS